MIIQYVNFSFYIFYIIPAYTMFIGDLYMHRNGEIIITSLYINKKIYILRNRLMLKNGPTLNIYLYIYQIVYPSNKL